MEVSLHGQKYCTEGARYVIDCEGVVGTLKRKITGKALSRIDRQTKEEKWLMPHIRSGCRAGCGVGCILSGGIQAEHGKSEILYAAAVEPCGRNGRYVQGDGVTVRMDS